MDIKVEKWFRKWLANDIHDMIDQSGPYTADEIELYDMVETTLNSVREAVGAVLDGEIGYHITACMPGNNDMILLMCNELDTIPNDELVPIIKDELNKYKK